VCQPRPILKLSESSCAHMHSTRNNNHILHSCQTRCEANFYKVDHEYCRAICFRWLTFLFKYSTKSPPDPHHSVTRHCNTCESYVQATQRDRCRRFFGHVVGNHIASGGKWINSTTIENFEKILCKASKRLRD